MGEIILASKSPRRLQLLGMLGLNIKVITSDVDEAAITADSPSTLAKKLSEGKARAVYGSVMPSCAVVGCDTLVEAEGEMLGKPRDRDDAIRMLSLMSGKTHLVHTGLTVIYRGKEISLTDTSKVKFRELDENEILDYVDSGEPMDKAGAYGIQGPAGAFVEKIEGDFFSIMGLPLCRLTVVLKELGININDLKTK